MPRASPLGDIDADIRARRRIFEPERVHGGKADLACCTAETVGEQKPAILGEAREQLAPHRNDADFPETGNQILQKRACVRGVSDGRRHHEGHATAQAQQAGGHHQEGRPRSRQTREPDAKFRTDRQGAAAHIAAEPLVADERRIAGRAIEPLAGPPCPFCPGEELVIAQARLWRSPSGRCGCLRIPFHADAVSVLGQKSTVAAGRIQQQIARRAHSRAHQHGRHRLWSVVGAVSLAQCGPLRRLSVCRHEIDRKNRFLIICTVSLGWKASFHLKFLLRLGRGASQGADSQGFRPHGTSQMI